MLYTNFVLLYKVDAVVGGSRFFKKKTLTFKKSFLNRILFKIGKNFERVNLKCRKKQ